MFSVIGLVGMIGILVNDSIILITTIDKYGESRGARQAIRDAVADRLRPVLLTTLTTVVGLIPLLYETSRQASFLKPTVITLVYGLGFGMFLVLLLVPALAAVQSDAATFTRSLRRALNTPKRGIAIRFPVLACAALIFIWFSLTIGHNAWFGELPVQLANLASQSGSLSSGVAGLMLFIIGSFAICVFAYLVTASIFLVGRRSS